MIEELWTTVIVRPQPNGGYNAPGSSFGNPVALQTTRALYEGPLQAQVAVAQAIFDQALALVLAGEVPRVVSESSWRRISSQATEPARRGKVRAESQRRRELAASLKEERRAEEAKAKAERNGHPAEATDEDHAAAEESLALALADTHEPAGDEEQDR